ncbi:hypothetical protein BX666DRAFT_1952669 [Dichotomocladium elegans]|nr:hypothetical protein BX666DRAFT_1952669 [Dichotomocladium elegans]
MAAGSLPLVPVSPLVKSSNICKNAYAQATERLSHAKQATDPRVEVSLLRRLIEDTRVEQHRLETVEQQMEAVEVATPFNWEPDVLARQVAAVDCQLFEKVIFKKKWLCNLDKKHTNLIHLVDFHRYLTNSFAHQLIYWSELNASSPVVPPVHPKDNLITHLVRTAYLLVHVYRDFSGFAAIMKALMLPEVRRLRKLWHTCPSRTRDLYRDLAQIISPSKNFQAYHDLLSRKLETFYSQRNKTIAIPWIQPHLQDIKLIVKEYTAGDEASGSAVLSAPGARKLSQVVSVLELCKQSSTSEVPPDELLLEDNHHKHKSKRMSVKPVQLDGIRTIIQPPTDLNQLVPGDLQLYHWLVSRVFLTKDQLIEESIQVEQLAPGEELACDKEEEDDEMEVESPSLSIPPTPVTTDFRSRAFDLPESPSLALGSKKASEETSHDNHNDNHDEDDEDNNGSDGDGDGDGGIATDELRIVVKPEVLEPTETSTEEYKTSDNKATTVEEDDLHNVWGDHKAGMTGKSQAAQSVTTNSSHQDSSASNQTKRSRLSPSAPEFIPSSKLSLAVRSDKATSQSMTTSSSVVVSPATSMRDAGSLLSAQEESAVAEQEDTEDPEEEWHGYMYHHATKDDSESEKWVGYPSPPLESSTPERRGSSTQSEDSEVWKGYHASKMEDDWQQEINRKVQDCEWQGYTLETLDEDELDSSTMMDGEFEKSRQARRKDDALDAFRRMQSKRQANWMPQQSS